MLLIVAVDLLLQNGWIHLQMEYSKHNPELQMLVKNLPDDACGIQVLM